MFAFALARDLPFSRDLSRPESDSTSVPPGSCIPPVCSPRSRRVLGLRIALTRCHDRSAAGNWTKAHDSARALSCQPSRPAPTLRSRHPRPDRTGPPPPSRPRTRPQRKAPGRPFSRVRDRLRSPARLAPASTRTLFAEARPAPDRLRLSRGRSSDSGPGELPDCHAPCPIPYPRPGEPIVPRLLQEVVFDRHPSSDPGAANLYRVAHAGTDAWRLLPAQVCRQVGMKVVDRAAGLFWFAVASAPFSAAVRRAVAGTAGA
jgi:hypothetical protein